MKHQKKEDGILERFTVANYTSTVDQCRVTDLFCESCLLPKNPFLSFVRKVQTSSNSLLQSPTQLEILLKCHCILGDSLQLDTHNNYKYRYKGRYKYVHIANNTTSVIQTKIIVQAT